MAKNAWLELVKAKYAEVKKEGKVKGVDAMKESLKRAKEVWSKLKKEQK